MAKTGILIETDDGKIKKSSLGLITAVREQQNEVTALIWDADEDVFKNDLARYGVSHIIIIKATSGELSMDPTLAARAVGATARAFELNAMLGLATTSGKDLFARMAAEMDLPLMTDCISVDIKAKTAVKYYFSGKVSATVQNNADLMLCTIRPNMTEPSESAATPEQTTYTADVSGSGRLRLVKRQQEASDKMELTEAPVVITGGRPMGSADNFKMLEDCATLLGAAVGASRAAVDAGYAAHTMQVGQTGKIVNPTLYLACGVSGSVQHFAGMKTSRTIVAINTDKEAPIFTKCDYGVLGDIFEVIPALTKALN